MRRLLGSGGAFGVAVAVAVAACSGGSGGAGDTVGGPGGGDVVGSGGSPDQASEFKTLKDFLDHPMLQQAMASSGFSGVCVDPGAPAVGGVYSPAMKITACGGCESSIGNETDPAQRIGYCGQQGVF